MFIEHNTVKVLQTELHFDNILMYPLNSTLALLNTLFRSRLIAGAWEVKRTRV